MADIVNHVRSSAQTTPEGFRRSDPSGRPPEQIQIRQDIEQLATNGHVELAFNLFRDAYKSLAAKNPKESTAFARDVNTQISADGLSEEFAAEWGLQLSLHNSSDRVITRSELEKTARNPKADYFSKAMASELSRDVSSLNPQSEGGFLGFGAHPAESVSKHELERCIDDKDRPERIHDLGTALLAGGTNSVFDQVAKSAGKNPDNSNDPLKLEDFQNFAMNNPHHSEATNRLVEQVIDRWDLVSLNALAEHFDGETMLTKGSIQNGLSKINSTGYWR